MPMLTFQGPLLFSTNRYTVCEFSLGYAGTWYEVALFTFFLCFKSSAIHVNTSRKLLYVVHAATFQTLNLIKLNTIPKIEHDINIYAPVLERTMNTEES